MNTKTTNISLLKEMDFDYTERERIAFVNECTKGIDSNKYDFVHVNSQEGERLVDTLNEPSIAGYDLLTRPSLPQFTVVFDDDGSIMRIVYISSYRHKKVKYENGLKIINKPMIDAYIYQSCTEGTPDAVITICAIRFSKVGSNDCITSTSHQVSFTNPLSSVGLYIREQEHLFTIPLRESEDGHPYPPNIIEWARDIKLLYLGIQQSLTHRATIFRERTEHREVVAGSTIDKNKKGRARRKVKSYRVISIIPEELEKIPDANKERRTFSCPSWGVIGHTRRLKSGKEIWVKPYVKGRERDSYSAKEYEIINRDVASV